MADWRLHAITYWEHKQIDFGNGLALEAALNDLPVSSMVGTKAVWEKSCRFHSSLTTETNAWSVHLARDPIRVTPKVFEKAKRAHIPRDLES